MKQPPGRRGRGRLRAATLVAWLGIPSLASGAGPESTASIHARFDEGKQAFQDKEYLEAARIFSDVLGRVEEVLLNRPTRENMMLNVLLAYEWAYRTSTDAEGLKDVTLLDEGQRVLDEYRAELSRVYKSAADPSPELAEAIARFEEARRIAHEKHAPPGQPPEQAQEQEQETEPPIGPCLSPPPPPPTRRGCGGNGDQDLAFLGVFALPLVRRRRSAVERLADRLPADVVQRLRDHADEDR